MTMTQKTIYDAAGMIVRVVVLTGDPVDDAIIENIPVGGGSVVGEYDSDVTYFVAGVATPRPTLVVDPEYEIDADGVDSVSFDVPDGTTVSVISLEERRRSTDGTTSCVTDIADADDLYVFRAKRRGDWELSVYPPAPYQYATVLVRAI